MCISDIFDNVSAKTVSILLFVLTDMATDKENSYGTVHSESRLCKDEEADPVGIRDKCLLWIKQTKLLIKSTTDDIYWMPYVALCLFFTTYCITAHSILAELPVFVQHAPEGQDLPAILAVMSCCSFVGPLCYILCGKLIKWRPQRWVVPLMLMLTLGTLQILMAFTWDVTTTISGSDHSVLLVLWAMLGYMTDSTITVQYPIYMEAFKSQYVSSICIGEALSTLLTSSIGMIQGVGVNQCVNVTIYTNVTDENKYKLISTSSPPVFTVTVYYIIICIITSTSIAAFLWINFSKSSTCANASAEALKYPLIQRNTEQEMILAASKNDSALISKGPNVRFSSRFETYTLFVLIYINWSIFRFYHFGIIQYACQSYLDTTYSLAIRSSFIVRSLITLCGLLVRVRSLVIMVLVIALAVAAEAYIISVAVMSPEPPLKGTQAGSNILVRLSLLVIINNIYNINYSIFKSVSLAGYWELKECHSYWERNEC